MSLTSTISQSSNTENTFYIKTDSKYYSITINSIKWIYAKGNHCTFYIERSSEITVRMSLRHFVDCVPNTILVRSHRNYLINWNKISLYAPEGYVRIGDQEIPVSKKYRKDVEEKLNLIN